MGCVKWEGGETLRLQKCRSNNPSMETMREEHEACTAHRPFSICRSVKVTIYQWRQWRKNTRSIRLTARSSFAEVKSNNPSMETTKEEHKAYTAHRLFSICRSVEVTIRQWRQRRKDTRHVRLLPVLHLQKCRSNNPSMETTKEGHEAYTVHRPFSICRSVKITIH